MVYSVLSEPVIPVLWPDGTRSSVGIREAFLRAHEIRDIQCDTPLERYALLRLLIAFAMDMLHPKNSFARRALLDSGQFDEDVFNTYIALCEQDGPRFDLFDPIHPFMQSRYDEELDAKAEKPVANLFPTIPVGNNHIFVDHRLENEHALSPDHAVRALCVIYLFCFPVGAKQYPSSVNNTPPIYVTINGKNLFETIVLNMLSVTEAGSISYGFEQVPWRTECSVIPKKAFPDVSLIEAYTWMPRRITLKLDDDGLIRTVYFQQGHNFQGNDLWKDPHVPYKEMGGFYTTIKPSSGRLPWRDIASLTFDSHSHNQPLILYRYKSLMEEELPQFIPVNMIGLVLVNNAKYYIWYADSLVLPKCLLDDDDMAYVFRNDVDFIESLQGHVYVFTKKVMDNSDKGDDLNSILKNHLKTPQAKPDIIPTEIATQCQQFFLHGAHDLLFGSAMEEICSGMPEKEHAEHFCKEMERLLNEMFRQVLRTAGSDANSIMRQMEAEKWIWLAYSKLKEERMSCYD